MPNGYRLPPKAPRARVSGGPASGLYVGRPNYSQDWPAYDAGQQDEHRLFDDLVWVLLEGVPEPIRPVGARGRYPTPLRTQLLHAIKKVHLRQSTRRAKGLLDSIYAGGTGILSVVPNYATPSRILNEPRVTEILLELIGRSARPLKKIEKSRTVAVDSSGFCLTCRGAYCSEKHEVERKHEWIKAHVVVGVVSHVILSATITDVHGADCPELVPLLEETMRQGFRPRKIVGDKAYLSRRTFNFARAIGAEAYVPFKSDSIGASRGSTEWARKFYEFEFKRTEFETEYHVRSNVESVFSSIKRKLGEPLASKNIVAQVNELLAKLLGYNIGILIHEMHEHGINPRKEGPPDPPYVRPPPVFEPEPPVPESEREAVIIFEVGS